MRQATTFEDRVTAIVMGGGAGTRLYPLTHLRAKPAVPLGGKYRLIDIPISNCINSGLRRIYILTQYNSTSLHTHISRSYHFDRFSKAFIGILAAQQSPQYTDAHAWYEGTADAVRKNLGRVRDAGGDEVLILSGDQIYQMDFRDALATHRGTGTESPSCGRSEVTIAARLVPKEQARSLGIMRIDVDTGRVIEFIEKPGDRDELFDGLEATEDTLARFGLSAADGPYYLANMGIYVFDQRRLETALDNEYSDFGREVLPSLLDQCEVRAHLFHGYWEDVGTIRTFHQANIDLAGALPQFNFYMEDTPVYTRARLLPASKIQGASILRSLISEGCLIEQARIEDSLIGIRATVGRDCIIRNTYVMGTDFYETEEGREQDRRAGRPMIGIGDGSIIENSIIDKNARVGRNVRLQNLDNHASFEDGHVIIRDGIVVVPRGGVIPDGYGI